MNLLKKLIIILLILLVIAVITFFVVTQLMNKEEQSDNTVRNNDVVVEAVKDTIKEVKDRNEFYTIKYIVNRYYLCIADMNVEEDDLYYSEEMGLENTRKLAKETGYAMLNEEYIQLDNITTQNIQSKLGNLKQVNVQIDKMYSVKNASNISIYFVYGVIRDRNTDEASNISLMITLDEENRIFAIASEKYMQSKGYMNIKPGDEIDIQVSSIKDKTYNDFSYASITAETISVDYLKYYSDNLYYNRKAVYDLLDEEYRNKRFTSYEEFDNYINNKYDTFIDVTLDEYFVVLQDGYTRYILTDKNGDFYVLKETAIMQYTMILDNYTIDVQEVVTKYNNSNTKEKVTMNINKFMQAINDKNYSYAYDVLADSFKENNFKTKVEFEQYAKNTFFDKNVVKYNYLRSEGELYVFEVSIGDSEGKDSTKISKTFIVKLGEGTNFEVSFDK